ncbi:MAG: T9SS type A sorting domain-containing protein [Flavobacteriales bacterium]|nr:T9SS type A sorting domain-containing protein [Flavobacteriales bacterium]
MGSPTICGSFIGPDPVFGQDTLIGGYQTTFLARVLQDSLSTGIAGDPQHPIRLYPDPADQYITMDSDLTSAEVFVHDVSGELMWSGFARSFPHQLDVSFWPAGLYCLKATDDHRTVRARFIVHH